MNYLVVSCSLNPDSRSKILAKSVRDNIQNLSQNVNFIDLAEEEIPFCDGAEAYSNPTAGKLIEEVQKADGIILCVPIYNYDINASAKNFIELTGRNWFQKVVGFACAAGGQGSYMSVMSVANSLMLDFRCHIVPRFVYATGSAFQGDTITDPEIIERLNELSDDVYRVTEALRLKT